MAGSHVNRVIEPWDSSGWPIDLFKDKQHLQDKRLYFCTRDGCGDGKYTRILREPWQLNCGHRVCKTCLEYIKELPEPQQICAACREEQFDEVRYRTLNVADPSTMDVDAQPESDALQEHAKIETTKTIADRAASREINKLEVVCPFNCGAGTSDGKKLLIRTLEKHMGECVRRNVPCEKCTETISFSDMADHLSNKCPFRLVECPNGCGKVGIQGRDLSRHLAECENKPPECRLCQNTYIGPFATHVRNECRAQCPLGCKSSKPGQLLVDHLREQDKLDDHIMTLYEVESNIMAEQGRLSNAGLGGAAGMTQAQTTSFLDRLLALECRAERTQRQLSEKVNQLTTETAVALLENARKAEANRKSLDDLESMFKVLASDVHLLTSYDITFRSLTEKVNKQEADTIERLNKLEGLSNIRLAEIEDQKTTLNHYQMTSFNGRLIWRIDKVQAKRNEAHIRHSVFSHPFYTEVYGYKMCARLYFNGDGNGKNSHISLFFVVMKGEYDPLLPWPFQQKVTMKLKNQAKKRSDIVEKFRPEPSSSSFARPKNAMNIASGCPQFATQDTVFDPQNGFVVDDTMFFEIIADNSYEALHGLNVSVQETRGSSNVSQIK